MMHNLIGENLARRNVVTIAESAGEDHDLEAIQHRRIVNHPVNMNPFDLSTGQLQRMLGLKIAVNSCRS